MKRTKSMFKTIHYLAYIFLLFSCTTKQETKNISWYKNQVIEQLEPQGDSVYRVQIGIMAAAFWLEKNNKEFDKYLPLLQRSLVQRDPINIAVEHNSNKIVEIKTTNSEK